MSADKLAKRYAKALFDDAQAKGILEAVNNDMKLINQAIDDLVRLQPRTETESQHPEPSFVLVHPDRSNNDRLNDT